MQGRLLGKGLVPSLLFIPPSRRMILHAFCAMNSNDLLKNFPTKRWGKIFYRRISSCGSVTCSFRKDLPRICVFPSHLESRNCDISEDITELIKQLLKLYEGLTERYRERINWLEEDCNDNSFRCQPVPVDEGCNARSRARPRFRVSKSQIKGLRDLGFKWSKIAALE